MGRALAAVLAILVALAWAGIAEAQTCPTQTTPNLTAGGSVFGRTSPQWNAYFGAKADAVDACLLNPTLVGTINLQDSNVLLPPIAAPTSTTVDVLGNGTTGSASPADFRLIWGTDLVQTCSAVTTPPSCTIGLGPISGSSIEAGSITAAQLAAGSVTSAQLASGAVAINLGFTPLNPANDLSELASKPTSLANLGGLPGVASTSALRGSCTGIGSCPSGDQTYPSGVIRLGFASASDGTPAMQFDVGTTTCATDDGASCVDSADGNHWGGVFPAAGYDIREWGTPDAATLTAALAYVGNLSSGGKILLPSALTLSEGVGAVVTGVSCPADTSCATITGQGQVTIQGQNNRGTTVTCSTGSAWCLYFSGIYPSLQMRGIWLRDIHFLGNQAQTGGGGAYFRGISQSGLDNVIFDQTYSCFWLSGTNDFLVRGMTYCVAYGGVPVQWYSADGLGVERSDVLTFPNDATIEQTFSQFTGSISGTTLTVSGSVTGPPLAPGMWVVSTGATVAADQRIVSGSGSTWTVSVSGTVASVHMYAAQSCLEMQDNVETLNMGSSNMLQCGVGIHVTETAANSSPSTQSPQFVQIGPGFAVDGSLEQAIDVDRYAQYVFCDECQLTVSANSLAPGAQSSADTQWFGIYSTKVYGPNSYGVINAATNAVFVGNDYSVAGPGTPLGNLDNTSSSAASFVGGIGINGLAIPISGTLGTTAGTCAAATAC